MKAPEGQGDLEVAANASMRWPPPYRRCRARWRAPLRVWAVLTIVATPVFGGHYAVEVIAGLLSKWERDRDEWKGLLDRLVDIAVAVQRRRPSGKLKT